MVLEQVVSGVAVYPFTPKSDQCQISPAASPEILHHTVWRTWLFIAYSDERWLYYQFSRRFTNTVLFKRLGECIFLKLRSERLRPRECPQHLKSSREIIRKEIQRSSRKNTLWSRLPKTGEGGGGDKANHPTALPPARARLLCWFWASLSRLLSNRLGTTPCCNGTLQSTKDMTTLWWTRRKFGFPTFSCITSKVQLFAKTDMPNGNGLSSGFVSGNQILSKYICLLPLMVEAKKVWVPDIFLYNK